MEKQSSILRHCKYSEIPQDIIDDFDKIQDGYLPVDFAGFLASRNIVLIDSDTESDSTKAEKAQYY